MMWPFNRKPNQRLDSWPIVRTKPIAKTYGRSISVFINNGSCHLTNVDVYADGVIDCWELVDRALFRQKIQSRWVVPGPTEAQDLSVFNFGYTGIERGTWTQTSKSIMQAVEANLRLLNPSMADLVDMQGSSWELRGHVRYATLGMSDDKPYKIDHASVEIIGNSVPVLRILDDAYELTQLFVFADGTCSIGSNDQYLPLANIAAQFDQKMICNAAPRGSRILLPGLGEFWTTRDFGGIGVHDRIGELEDMCNQLNGQPGVVEKCRKAFNSYSTNPSEQEKTHLRKAYEAVPTHLRMYCGDMDSKDTAIRVALSRRK